MCRCLSSISPRSWLPNVSVVVFIFRLHAWKILDIPSVCNIRKKTKNVLRRPQQEKADRKNFFLSIVRCIGAKVKAKAMYVIPMTALILELSNTPECLLKFLTHVAKLMVKQNNNCDQSAFCWVALRTRATGVRVLCLHPKVGRRQSSTSKHTPYTVPRLICSAYDIITYNQ